MRKIGVNFTAKWGLEFPEFLQKIKELGFDAFFTGVPAITNIPAMAKAAEENGLEWETLHAPFGHINDIWRVGEGGDIMLRELLNSVDCCVLAGARILVVHLSSGNNAPPITDIGRARFTELVDYAATKNVTIAFENQRKLANLAWTMEEFGSRDNVGFCWDCGHESCFTPGRQYMPIFGKYLVCTHLHDNHGEYNKDEHLIPFDGSTDMELLARQIKESGYEGSLMLEILPRNSHYYDDMTYPEYLTKAYAAVTRLRDMVDGE
ncbi:MAG: TIM barrel protein [Clostridia bacterium]|nr:TIM barrel protein [Clostridia bacterium]